MSRPCLSTLATLTFCLLTVSPVKGLEQQRLFAPIQLSPTAETWKDTLAVQRTWAKRTLLTPFHARATGKSWAAEAEAFAERAADYLVYMPDLEPPAKLVKQGEKLCASGCTDPLIVFLSGHLEALDENASRVPYAQYKKALAEARGYEGPKALAWLIAREIVSLRLYEMGQAINATELQAAPLALAVLSDGSYQPKEDELYLAHLLTTDWDNFMKKPQCLGPLAEKAPLGEWLQEMLRGYTKWAEYFPQAVTYDNSQSAVTEGALEPLDEGQRMERLRGASAAFEHAWKLRPDRPEAATMMMPVTYFQNGTFKEARTWFERATAAQVDYFPAYCRMLDRCSPGMGGSQKMMLDFGDACRVTGRYDTVVPQLFFGAVVAAAKLAGDWKEIYRQPEIAAKLIELSRALADAPGREAARPLRLDFLAANAFLAGDIALAAQVRKEHPGQMCFHAIAKLYDYNIFDFDQQVSAAGTDVAASETKAMRLRQEGSYEAAYQTIAEGLPKATGVEQWQMKWQLRELDFQRQFATGDWVRQPDNPKDEAWLGAEWAHDKYADHRGRLPAPFHRVVHAFALGRDVEVRGEFSGTSTIKDAVVLHTFLAHRQFTDRPVFSREVLCAGVEIRAQGDGRYIARLRFDERDEGTEETVDLRAHNTFLLRLDHGRFTFLLNDHAVFENVPWEMDLEIGQDLVFGYDGPPVVPAPEKIEMRKAPKIQSPGRGSVQVARRRALLVS